MGGLEAIGKLREICAHSTLNVPFAVAAGLCEVVAGELLARDAPAPEAAPEPEPTTDVA